jgi:hypothetical protein
MLDLGHLLGNGWFDEPSGVPVEAYAVIRVREYYNFWLGTRLGHVDELRVGISRLQVARILFPIGDALNKFLQDTTAPMPMCAGSGADLWAKIVALMPDPATFDASKPDDWKLSLPDLMGIRETCKAFDVALSIQFDHLDTYRVMPKGTHDTRKLIEHPEMAFEGLWGHMRPLAQEDWASGSRCLAFDLPTACGFHVIRSMEATVVQYLDLKKIPHPKRDLGEYVRLMRSAGVPDDATDIVEQIRKHHRNPLMHPDDVLDVSEAMAIFDLTKTAQIYVIKHMLSAGLIQ